MGIGGFGVFDGQNVVDIPTGGGSPSGGSPPSYTMSQQIGDARRTMDANRRRKSYRPQGSISPNGQATTLSQGGGQQSPGMADQLNGMLIGGYADAGNKIQGASDSIGSGLQANANRENLLLQAQTADEGKTKRLSMLMNMMGGMLGGGGMGGGGGSSGFMTNFGQAAIPGSMLGGGMGMGGGGGMKYNADGSVDYGGMQTQNDFYRNNMLRTLAGLQDVFQTKGQAPKGQNPSSYFGGGRY